MNFKWIFLIMLMLSKERNISYIIHFFFVSIQNNEKIFLQIARRQENWKIIRQHNFFSFWSEKKKVITLYA